MNENKHVQTPRKKKDSTLGEDLEYLLIINFEFLKRFLKN